MRSDSMRGAGSYPRRWPLMITLPCRQEMRIHGYRKVLEKFLQTKLDFFSCDNSTSHARISAALEARQPLEVGSHYLPL